MPPKRKRSSTSRSPPPKKKKVRDESDYNTWTVEELREELSSKELPTKGTKQVLIDRLSGKEPETPKTPTRPKRSAAKKAVASDSSEDEEEEKPRKRTTRAPPPKRGARKAPVRKKRDWEGSSDSEPEDENDDSGSESPEEAPAAKSTRLPRAAARVVKTHPWTVEDSVVYYLPAESNDSDKVAAFDMDSTLIVTKSGKTFAQGRNDWKWLFEEVPVKLKEYHDNGYKIVIISNQAGVGPGKKTSVETVAGKILDLAEDAKIPIAFIFATGDDKYRKPATGMWELLQEKTGKTFDAKESFYVGDAAGRHEGWKPGVKKDFGCSDRKFAHNIPIRFYTPEEFFLGEEPPADWDWRGVVPDEVPETGKIADDESDIVSTEKELILFIGYPASGKSTFAKTHLIPKGYVHVNRDTLKTPAKCLKVAREALTEGKSVVIDNTNPSKKAREPYLSLAEELKVPARCYHFQTSQELAQHLNEFREVITDGESKHVPTLVYRKFAKDFEEPTLDEGFTQIKKIHFVRSHPDDKHRTIFGKLTERHG